MRSFAGVRVRSQRLQHYSGFANLGKSGKEGFFVGLVGVIRDGHRLVAEVTDDILNTFLKGDILHHFVAAALTMQVTG